MKRKSPTKAIGKLVALPRERYFVGNYQGYEDNEFHWDTPKAKNGAHVKFASLVHLAKTNAAQNGIPFPAELGRPSVRENMQKGGSIFEKYSATSSQGKKHSDVQKPVGLYDGPEYANRPEPQWLISNILVETGYSIASGRSQAGKSFCELAQALSIVTGRPWLDEQVLKTGPVLYVAAEGQARIWKDVCAWCLEFGVDPESLRGKFFVFDRSARLNTAEGQQDLKDILAYIEHVYDSSPVLAVFDTLRRNMRGGVSQEEPTSEVLHAVNELQVKGIAVTLIAHHGRGHGETKGLTEWEDDADQVRIYTGKVRERSTTITFSKVKSGEDGWSIAVEYSCHELPDGSTTMVALRGKRNEPSENDGSKKGLFQRATEDRTAVEILEVCNPPKMSRGNLAAAVLQKLEPVLEDDEPEKFKQHVLKLARRFGRLRDGELFRCAAEWGSGKNQEILSFAMPSNL
jgi:hypothetical protein